MTGRYKSVVFMLLSAAAFSVMGAFVKAAEFPVMEKVLFRNLITLVIAGIFVIRAGRSFLGSLCHQPLLFARSLLGLGGVTCYFYAIDHLILADAAMLTKLSPFFVAVFAFFLLDERPSEKVVFAMTVAFVGGLCIVKPKFDFSVVPALIGMASSVFAGGAYTAVRSLRSREHPETIIFHFSLVTTIALLPVAVTNFQVPSGREWFWLFGIGVFAAIGQFGLTFAYRHAPAAQVSVYSYTMILFSALLGFSIWSEMPDLLSILGGILIIFGGLIGFLAEKPG